MTNFTEERERNVRDVYGPLSPLARVPLSRNFGAVQRRVIWRNPYNIVVEGESAGERDSVHGA